jgi:putative transposase
MQKRKTLIVTGQVYHIFSKSIAEFKIFNNNTDTSRMIHVIRYYQREKPPLRFSQFINSPEAKRRHRQKLPLMPDENKLVEIIAYCLMPTHLHLILKQLKDKGISTFMGTILNSYTRYFNAKHSRKGPLWEARFKNVLVENDEQLLHLTRYIHLNPVTAYLVDKPEQWAASSYHEYLSQKSEKARRNNICRYEDILDIKPASYREFVEDRISYQRELAQIRTLLCD